jgi:hypothetical protein
VTPARPGGGEFNGDYADTGAGVEKMEALEGPATEFRQENTGADIGAVVLIAAQIAVGDVGIEVVGGSTGAEAAGHVVNLDGVEERGQAPPLRRETASPRGETSPKLGHGDFGA